MAGLSEMPPDADELEETWLEGEREWLAFSSMVLGYRLGTGVPLVATTGGGTMSAVNLANDTECMSIPRHRRTLRDLYLTFMSRLDAMGNWRESKGWGPCPFTHPEEYDDPPYTE